VKTQPTPLAQVPPEGVAPNPRAAVAPQAEEHWQRALARLKPGHALPQEFYCDPQIFERERRRLLERHWHCAGHHSQIPETGDFFTTELFGESLILVRGADAEVYALINVCRHRGSRVCTQRAGRARGGFICPYHAWNYALDGTLKAAARMPKGFERSRHGLRRAHCRVLEGLIFVSFADQPLSLDSVADLLAGTARVYGWADAQVAYRESYPVNANWKLAVENYMECYHCGPAHEEYSRFHLYARPAALNAEADERVRARARSLGIEIAEVSRWGRNAPPGHEGGGSLRSALAEGTVSGSDDGKPLAPLMGQFRDYDGGVTFFDVGLTSDFLAYPDHGLIYRFIPRTVSSTEMEVLWLVNGTARAGADYDPERLTWLWKVTSVADKRIIELNQQGINSQYYEPGPYSEMEQDTRRYVDWLLAELQ